MVQGSDTEGLEGPDSQQVDDDWLLQESQPRKARSAESETQLSAQSSAAELREPLLKEG